MHDEFATAFWRNAYNSLPAHIRARYHSEFVAAERWELALRALIETWTRVKGAVRGILQPGFAK